MTAPADVTASLQAKFPAATLRPSGDHPALNLPMGEVVAALKYLRDEFAYDFLVDVTAIDNGVEATPRFTTVWHVYSTTGHGYVRIASDCASDEDPVAPTVSHIWPTANWHERETYDLLGVKFSDHPDLRRILMWDGYPYHPLRKDFPLAGIQTPLPDLEVADLTKASVKPAPMMGGPFVASSGEMNMTDAEPRAKDESWTERREKPASE
ncbi:NADH-quinone oxidoreductase subunit C [Rariglobus hedericola]|uniref:NADH-quinone oxidoreductase subunit C n=1 Tax=Rariglobus hedericola TaxID=2597822 RepID=A0A556QKE0_9BACT|nr:NADH-quinone oxidoreductase subunit C [Rariglobus hedericola]TSJ77114.1 NADH-quinone oxidoreductase subunit C [Rariglobus hedericola]